MKIMVWGDMSIYDSGLENIIENFFHKIIAYDDEIRVYFVNFGDFSKLTLSAIKRVERYNCTKIETIYVSSGLLLCDQTNPIEQYFNRTVKIYTGSLEDTPPFYVRRRAVIKDVLKQVDTLLCYFYKILSPNEFKLISQSTIATNCISDTTTKKLNNYIKSGDNLNDRQKFVLSAFERGDATKTIAETLHVSSAQIYNIRNLAIRRLKAVFVIHSDL